MRGPHGAAPEDRTRGTAKGEREPNRERTPSESVMSAALKLLATRSYSEGELRDRLARKGWTEVAVVADCIERLKELGYIDDDLFAHSYASYRVRSKPVGRARLRRELATKKVPPASIDRALDLVFGEAEEESLIDKAIARRVRTHGNPKDRAAAKRMFDHLARLGFEFDLIARKLRALKSGTEDNDE